jgi:acetyl-CoA acetyltransferase
MSDVFLLSAARTAIGGFGGSLKDYQPGELGAVALRAAIERANVDAAQIGHVDGDRDPDRTARCLCIADRCGRGGYSA